MIISIDYRCFGILCGGKDTDQLTFPFGWYVEEHGIWRHYTDEDFKEIFYHYKEWEDVKHDRNCSKNL